MKELIKNETEFLESIEAEHNSNGAYVYTSQNGHEEISLAFILLEYKQWLIENKKLNERS